MCSRPWPHRFRSAHGQKVSSVCPSFRWHLEFVTSPMELAPSMGPSFWLCQANTGKAVGARKARKKLAKRLLDSTCSALGTVVLCPLFALIGLAIKLESKGPVFYRGVRAGRFGEHFRIFKFRTMVEHAEVIGSASTPE